MGLNSLMQGKGLLGMQMAQPPAGLLGPYYDPKQERQQKLLMGLQGAGLALLQNGKGSFGEVLGQGATGFAQGANNAGINYRQDAMGYQQLEAQMAEQREKQKQRNAIAAWVSKLPPEEQSMAEAYPEQYAQQYLQQQFATSQPKAPSMETLYDDKTGQPYKAQWDTQTNSWKRVGGNKADENGITITNPDGTTTQIGGSGAKTTEADRRAKLLTEQIVAQEPQLLASFDSLASVQNSVGGATGQAGRGFMSGEGQLAIDAMRNVVQNWMYLTSGATAPEQEVQRNLQNVLPTALDKTEVIAAKKARLQMMIDSMKGRSGMPATNQVPATKKPPVTINGYTIQEE